MGGEWLGQVSKGREPREPKMRRLRGAAVPGGTLRGADSTHLDRGVWGFMSRERFPVCWSCMACPPSPRSHRMPGDPQLHPATPSLRPSAGSVWPRSVEESGWVGVCVFVLFITFIYRPKAVGTYIFKYKLLLYCIFPSHQSAASVLKYIPNIFYK